MAKRKEKIEGEGPGIAGILVLILSITTFLSVMALLIKCDVGGFGSSILRPVLKDVPVIKELLPPPSDAEVAKESDYPYDTLEEALEQIKLQEAAIGSKDAEIKTLTDKVEELEKEQVRLSEFEDRQTEFEEEKNKFYNEVVYGDSAPGADTYIEWYNTLDAEYAEKIYREMLEAKEVDKEIKELASAYEAMEPKNAASILEKMNSDLDTVALILNNMNTKSRGVILENMSADYAALVSKKLLP